jgi:hypothetical protein
VNPESSPQPLPHPGVKPCSHMKLLLSSLADGTLTGMVRWFAEQHARGCEHCGQTLENLLILRSRLRAINSFPKKEDSLALTAERRAALEATWKEMDERSEEGANP